MANLLNPPKFQEFDANGDPLAGGKVYTYVAGTTTPLATYSDYAGATPNTNPVVLDSSGRASIYTGNATYKFILKDSSDVTIYTVDNYTAPMPGDSDDGSETPWTRHTITDNQAATALSGETIDFSTYSSAAYDCEVIRGTTVIANFSLAIQNLNGTGRVSVGMSLASEAHGLTFSLSASGTVNTLRVATSSGPGAGTLKLSRKLVPV